MTGWIRLHRGWRDCEVFGDEPMTEREAWVWLIEKAAWKPCVRRNAKGERVQIERGQFHTSLRNLGEAWSWGKNKVARYLERLEDHEMIGTVSGQSGCTITICNYDAYQDVQDSLGQEGGTAPGQSRDTQEEGKEYTSEDKSSSVVSPARTQKADPFPCPDDVDTSDWNGLKANRKAKRAPLTEAAYRQIITKLDRWKQDGWPPGPIVACAAERGWTTVFETDEMKGRNNANNRQRSTGGNRGRDGFLNACFDAGAPHADYPYAGNG